MLKLKLFVVLMVALAVGPGVWLGVRAQAGDQDSKKKVQTKAKELPAEIPIPEARTDKVRLFQEQHLKCAACIFTFYAGGMGSTPAA